MKQHAIIEKTARFIASQGVQMEILLKAKQSNNVQFEFLAQNSILNAYYKHMIQAIKDGKYPEQQQPMPAPLPMQETELQEEIAAAAAAAAAASKPIITVPTVKYKPSADCAYTQLISKIKGVPLSELHDESSWPAANSGNNSPCLSSPVLLKLNGATYVQQQDDENSNSGSVISSASANQLNDSQPKVEILKNTSALALAQNYSSGSEESDEEESKTTKPALPEKEKTPPKLDFPIPTEALKNIIDKTAVYVIKNGRQFEETLLSKSNERFTFLMADNEYYPYYMYKITDDPLAASKEQKKKKAKEVAEALMSKKRINVDKGRNC